MHITKRIFEDAWDAILTQRTIAIIEKHGRILIKFSDGWYMGSWTNIAAGPDQLQKSKKKNALEMFNLKWAFAIAKLYGGKVVVSMPKPPRPIVYEGGPEFISAVTGGDPSYTRKADGSR